jgi:hypothetical protein
LPIRALLADRSSLIYLLELWRDALQWLPYGGYVQIQNRVPIRYTAETGGTMLTIKIVESVGGTIIDPKHDFDSHTAFLPPNVVY